MRNPSPSEDRGGFRYLYRAAWGCALTLCLLSVLAAQSQQPPPSQQGQVTPPAPAKEKDKKAAIPHAVQPGKKLFLKNGTFQVVRSYERKGDRVRYYSLERSAWEEIPANLVDWDATSRAEAEEQKETEALEEKIRTHRENRLAADVDVDASLEVAPGVFLPEAEGFYIVEGRVVLPLTQAAANVRLDKANLLKQVIVPIPVVPTKRRIELPGKQASFRVSTAQPEFYMRTEDEREPEMELVRARVKGDKREIEVLNTYFTGQQSEKRDTISVQRWTIARGVYRFTLSQELPPGEYAFAEILPDGMNLWLWDFGVDPQAKSVLKKDTP